jgi:hypothetical protein
MAGASKWFTEKKVEELTCVGYFTYTGPLDQNSALRPAKNDHFCWGTPLAPPELFSAWGVKVMKSTILIYNLYNDVFSISVRAKPFHNESGCLRDDLLRNGASKKHT